MMMLLIANTINQNCVFEFLSSNFFMSRDDWTLFIENVKSDTSTHDLSSVQAAKTIVSTDLL